MILTDQATCFPSNVVVAFSSKDDGTVLDRAVGIHNPSIVTNRTKFCDSQGVSYGDVAYQRIIYDERGTYNLIAEIDSRSTTAFTSEIMADALFTRKKHVGILLPVGDCVATVMYDEKKQFLAVAHLGRHSSLAGLIPKLTRYFTEMGSNLRDVTVWMSPSAQKDSYALEFFTHENEPEWQGFYEYRDGVYYLDMQGHNKQQFIEGGIPSSHIFISPVNTMRNEHYFSHAGGDKTGRMALLAMMR